MDNSNMIKAKNSIYGVKCATCKKGIRRGAYVCGFRQERLVSHWRCRHDVLEETKGLKEAFTR